MNDRGLHAGWYGIAVLLIAYTVSFIDRVILSLLVQPIQADLGVSDGQWVEIRSGLGPEDQVVVDGVYELKLATSERGADAKGGHFHADGTWHAEPDK